MRFRTRARLALATLLTLAFAGALTGQAATADDGSQGRDAKPAHGDDPEPLPRLAA